MNCAMHPAVEAAAKCTRCGEGYCEECAVVTGGSSMCPSCLSEVLGRSGGEGASIWRHPSRLVAALLSIIPGAGHMYLGLIGKGFAMMGLLAASVFLVVLYSDATGMYWITAYLVPTLSVLMLCYAVFDSLAVASALRAGRKPTRDPTMDLIAERVLFSRRVAGYVILLAGIVGILDLFERAIGELVRSALGMDVPVTAFVVPVTLLAVGIRLLARGGRGRGG